MLHITHPICKPVSHMIVRASGIRCNGKKKLRIRIIIVKNQRLVIQHLPTKQIGAFNKIHAVYEGKCSIIDSSSNGDRLLLHFIFLPVVTGENFVLLKNFQSLPTSQLFGSTRF